MTALPLSVTDGSRLTHRHASALVTVYCQGATQAFLSFSLFRQCRHLRAIRESIVTRIVQ